jgi:hypothetical protein
MSDLIVVLAACAKDAALMRKNLQWQIDLGGCKEFRAVCAFGGDLNDSVTSDILALARRCYSFVWRFDYPRAKIEHWPWGPNHAFRQTAHYMRTHKSPWLWFEPDVIPLKRDWLKTLHSEYHRAGRKFMGTIVPEAGHCNGAAIYPADTPNLIPRTMMMQSNMAWDALMQPEMINLCHNASHLIQHAWGRVDGRFHHLLGESPSFPMPSDLYEINPDAVVLHRNKDGTLIDRLRESLKIVGQAAPALSPNGQMDIFIRTFHRDAPWLSHALQSIRRFCRGYGGVHLVYPQEDESVIRQCVQGYTVTMHPVQNNPGVGYLEQQVSKLTADTFTKADYILFVDSDCFMFRNNQPADWFTNGKIPHLITPWNMVGDAKMWKAPTEKALGCEARYETMRRFPLVFPRSVIAGCRQHVERLHRKPIRDYVIEQQSFSEFNVLGTYAMQFAPHAFTFLDTTINPLPPLIARQYWSWGGLTDAVKQDMEQILKHE